MVLCGSLQCQVSSYLVVYPCFTLISVFCTMSFMITLPGASGFKAQMVAPCIGVRTTVSVTPKVILNSWRSLCAPGDCFAIPDIIYAYFHGDRLLGPGPKGLLTMAWFYQGHLLRPGPMEIAASRLFLQSLLVLARFCGVH